MENLWLYLVAAVVIIGILWQLIRIFRQNKKEEPLQPVTNRVADVAEAEVTDPDEPVVVFTGPNVDCDLLQSLLKNAEIEAFQYYGDSSSMGAGLAPGNPPDRVLVARKDLERAGDVVDQFRESFRNQDLSAFDDLDELAEEQRQ